MVVKVYISLTSGLKEVSSSSHLKKKSWNFDKKKWEFPVCLIMLKLWNIRSVSIVRYSTVYQLTGKTNEISEKNFPKSFSRKILFLFFRA